MDTVEIDAAELKQLRKENRILKKKLQRAQSDLSSLEKSKRNRESLHRKVILELEDSQAILESQKEELQQLLDDLNKTHTKLIEAEKFSALGQLVAGVAHEINTPIGTSITLASTLVDETEIFRTSTTQGTLKRSQLNHYLEIAEETTTLITDNLNRAGELVQTFKQVAVDQSHYEQRSFEVKSYLDNVFKSLAPQITKRGHRYEIQGPNIYIDSYPGLFAQIITNLAMNSLHHAFGHIESGQLRLKLSYKDEILTLCYRDNGCGIPQALLKKVYEPFYTTARQSGGTGLGLHIVYNIVTQKLQGNIQITSEVNQGTQFEITLPIKGNINHPPLKPLTASPNDNREPQEL